MGFGDERIDGGYRGEPDSPQKTNTISFQVTAIQELLMAMDETISSLEDRLQPLLAPEYDSPEKGSSSSEVPATKTMSDLAEQLESYASRIDRHNRRIHRLYNRVNL
jgi:hypothetical protein